MTAAVLFYVVAFAAAATTVARAIRLRDSANRPAARAYLVILAALTVTFAAMATPSQAWINPRIPDGGKLAGNLATLIAAYGLVALHSYTRWPPEQAWPRLRWRLGLLAAACATLVVTFVWPHPVALTGSFDGLYTVDSALAVYTVAYALFLALALIDHILLSWAFARPAPRFLKAGLRLLALAGVGGLVYAVSKLAIVAHHVLTDTTEQPGGADGVCRSAFSSLGCTVAVGGPGVIALLVLAGVVACACSARLEGLAEWAGALRTYWRLQPLWTAVTTAVPEARDSIPAEINNSAEVGWRLRRRYVETRDALLQLSHWHPAVPTSSTSRTPEADAIAIRDAIAAKRAGQAPTVEATPVLAMPSDDLGFAADTVWLEKVAAAYTRLERGRSGRESAPAPLRTGT